MSVWFCPCNAPLVHMPGFVHLSELLAATHQWLFQGPNLLLLSNPHIHIPSHRSRHIGNGEFLGYIYFEALIGISEVQVLFMIRGIHLDIFISSVNIIGIF